MIKKQKCNNNLLNLLFKSKNYVMYSREKIHTKYYEDKKHPWLLS